MDHEILDECAEPTNGMISAIDNVSAQADVEILKSVPEQFEIRDEASANWLVRRIVAARVYAEHVREWAAAETRRAGREEEVFLRLYGRQLEEWAVGEIKKLNGRRKSIALPSGFVGFRTVRPSLQVEDEQAVISWAKEHLPDAVVVTEKLSRAVLKDHFGLTGVVPDAGAHIDQGGEKFFVR